MFASMVLRATKVCRSTRQRLLLLVVVAVILWTFVIDRLPTITFSIRPDRFVDTHLYVNSWYTDQTTFCGRNYTSYGHRFFGLNSAIYHPDVDAFSIICKSDSLPPRNWFWGEYAPKRYTKSLMHTAFKYYNNDMAYKKGITIAIYREYAHNFYHAMTQWYNIFVLSKLFKFDIADVNILLLDRSVPTHLDEQWPHHFRQVIKTENLTKPTKFENVLFSIPGHESPMYYFNVTHLPYIDEFSERFLRTFNLQSDKKLDCKNLTIVLYVRHDYYFHPGIDKEKRNTERKLKNEEELVAVLKEEFKGHNVRTLLSEEMSLEDQLRLAVDTDVLIGMHGCGLTHTLFMPKHATVLELFPITWKILRFFSSYAKWRGISHEYWRNPEKNFHFEKEHYTYVPPKMFRDYAKRAKSNLGCIS